jgi:hypothetical protein
MNKNLEIYTYKYGDRVGEYINIGKYKDKHLIYSLTTDYSQKFFLILDVITSEIKYQITDLDEIKKYEEKIKNEYDSFKLIMETNLNTITNKNKYNNIYMKQNDIGQKNIYEACKFYYEEDTLII